MCWVQSADLVCHTWPHSPTFTTWQPDSSRSIALTHPQLGSWLLMLYMTHVRFANICSRRRADWLLQLMLDRKYTLIGSGMSVNSCWSSREGFTHIYTVILHLRSTIPTNALSRMIRLYYFLQLSVPIYFSPCSRDNLSDLASLKLLCTSTVHAKRNTNTLIYICLFIFLLDNCRHGWGQAIVSFGDTATILSRRPVISWLACSHLYISSSRTGSMEEWEFDRGKL